MLAKFVDTSPHDVCAEYRHLSFIEFISRFPTVPQPRAGQDGTQLIRPSSAGSLQSPELCLISVAGDSHLSHGMQ
jgi:hypothetical protein